MPDQNVAVLTAQFEELSRKLIAVTNLSERAEMLEQMCALLQEIQVLLRVSDTTSEFPE